MPKLPLAAGHLLAGLAGALVTLSLAPFNIWPLGIVSCALLAWLLQGLSPWQTALRGWFYGAGLFGAGASWVYVSIHLYGNAPAPLAALLTTLFCLALGLFTAIPLYFYGRYIRDTRYGNTLGFAALWLLSEWWRSWLLTGFPWLYVGYAHIDTPLAGWGPVTGVLGIGFIVALAGSSLAALIPQRRQALAGTALAAILMLSGWVLQSVNWTTLSDRPPLRVALVQANIDQANKWRPDHYWPTLNLYRQLSAPLWQRNDLVIWPEAAIPAVYRQAESFLRDMQQLATLGGSHLVLGIPTTESAGSRHKTFNSIMVLGDNKAVYHKQRLVPFGEYVPLEGLLRGVIDFFDLPMSAFSRGNSDQAALQAGSTTLSPSVCYEVVYGDLVASMPGDILLTVSNDAWFGDSIGPLQHMQMAQMRALENGRYLVRATGNGISAIVDERGRIIQRSEQFTRQVLEGKARVFEGHTPFTQTGSWPWVLLASATLAVIIYRGKVSNRP